LLASLFPTYLPNLLTNRLTEKEPIIPPTEKMATERDHREVRSCGETAFPLRSVRVLLKNLWMICKKNQVGTVTIQ